MGTQTRYPRRVARPKYVPPDEETAAEIDRVATLYQAWRDAEAAYKSAVTALTDPQGRDVPIAHFAAKIGVERKTVYRHTGRSMT
jgi:hypothetical protein